MSARLDIVLVEPYYGGSHRAWADGLVTHSRHRVRLVTHKDQFWRWRMRGAAVTVAEAVRADVATHGVPDALLASDMIDLAALLGFLRRDLPTVPVALYMHENQLVYPLGPGQRFDEGLALRNWTSMAVADAIWFNSEFHMRACFDALPELLRRPPEQRHLHLLEPARARTAVIPVGVELAELVARPRPASDGPPLVVWNQRWDHDKNPGAVFRSLVKLAAQGVEFRLAVAGENARIDPREFQWVQDHLGDRVVHVGELDRSEYLDLLLAADVCATAARHEFFGIAPVEAMAAGCIPVWPDRLSYPELVPTEFHADAIYPGGGLRTAMRRALNETDDLHRRLEPLRTAMLRFDWAAVAPQYDDALERLVGLTGGA